LFNSKRFAPEKDENAESGNLIKALAQGLMRIIHIRLASAGGHPLLCWGQRTAHPHCKSSGKVVAL